MRIEQFRQLTLRKNPFRAFLISAMLAAAVCISPEGASSSPNLLGVNLDHHASWSPQILWVNAFMQARPWIPSPVGQPTTWESPGVSVPVGRDGYPTAVPFNAGGVPHIVKTLMLDAQGGRYPDGNWTLEFEGRGEIRLAHDASGVFDRPGRHSFTVRPTDRGIRLEIHRSEAADPVRNIRVIMPGHESSYRDAPFYPPAIESLRGFSVLRVMNLTVVNGRERASANGVPLDDPRCVTNASALTHPDAAIQAGPRGAAIEHQMRLTEAVGAEPWICIPHEADEGYIRGMAERARSAMAGGRRAWVELSNEIWNFSYSYPQAEFYRRLGTQENLNPGDPTDAGRMAYVRRAVRAWEIFEEVFGRERIVRVMPGQFGNPWHSGRMLELLGDPRLNPRAHSADVLAIGAYFAIAIADDVGSSGRAGSTSVDDVLTRVERSITEGPANAPDDNFAQMVRANSAAARKYDARLVAYEAGQHLVGTGENERNEALTNLLVAANRHPRMRAIYASFLREWYGNGGDMLVLFSIVGAPSKHGAWGLLEYFGQPAGEAPKFAAILDYMGKNPPASVASVASRRDAPAAPPAECAQEACPSGFGSRTAKVASAAIVLGAVCAGTFFWRKRKRG